MANLQGVQFIVLYSLPGLSTRFAKKFKLYSPVQMSAEQTRDSG